MFAVLDQVGIAFGSHSVSLELSSASGSGSVLVSFGFVRAAPRCTSLHTVRVRLGAPLGSRRSWSFAGREGG